MSSLRQALHWVFKVPSPRTETMKFYRDILGMKILRHEEFEKGCEAACNGPYDGKYVFDSLKENNFLPEIN